MKLNEGRNQGSEAGCRLYVGTSGYSFPEWIEAGFYPQGTANKDMLVSYSRQFNAVEINYTWYQMPNESAMQRMLSRVPAGFMFTTKLTRTMTHAVDPKNWRHQVAAYRKAIEPLTMARRLLAILVQLGPAFQRNQANRLYLAHLLDELAGIPTTIAVEFRHRSWADDKVYAELEKRRVALVAVDIPDLPDLFPTEAIVTTPELFYARFHGRNVKGWRSGNMQNQSDYDYNFRELSQWSEQFIPQMAEKTRAGAIFFNNHVRGQAPCNAQTLMDQLSGHDYGIKGFNSSGFCGIF